MPQHPLRIKMQIKNNRVKRKSKNPSLKKKKQ